MNQSAVHHCLEGLSKFLSQEPERKSLCTRELETAVPEALAQKNRSLFKRNFTRAFACSLVSCTEVSKPVQHAGLTVVISLPFFFFLVWGMSVMKVITKILPPPKKKSFKNSFNLENEFD